MCVCVSEVMFTSAVTAASISSFSARAQALEIEIRAVLLHRWILNAGG